MISPGPPQTSKILSVGFSDNACEQLREVCSPPMEGEKFFGGIKVVGRSFIPDGTIVIFEENKMPSSMQRFDIAGMKVYTPVYDEDEETRLEEMRRKLKYPLSIRT